MSRSPRRVLITGGAGFIGSHLADSLVERGHRVTAIDDLSTGSIDNVRHLIEADGRRRGAGTFSFVHETIFDQAVLDHLMSEAEVVYHLAASVGVQRVIEDTVRAIETNIFGTREVLHLARRHGCKVLIASTSEVYGKTGDAPFREGGNCVFGSTTTARWSYAASKAIDEVLGLAYHRQYGVPVVVFRLFNTIGPRQTGEYGMVVPRFVRQGLAGEPLTIYGDGEQTRCFCDVEDAVGALIGLAEEPRAVGRLFNVGSTEEISINALARLILQIIDEEGAAPSPSPEGSAASPAAERPAPVRHIPYDEAYAGGFEDMRRRVPDIGRIRAAIGWQPTISLRETLRKAVRFELERPGSDRAHRLAVATSHPRK